MRIAIKRLSQVMFTILLMSGCSTTGSSVGTGAGLGGLAGAGVGALADPGPGGQNRFRNVVIGTAVGGLLGAGTGALIDQHERNVNDDAKKEGRKEADDEWKKRMSSQGSSDQPELVSPKTEAHWIPGQVRGSTFVPGHMEYQIIENAHWNTK